MAKCECPDKAIDNSVMEFLYEPEELLAMKGHEPFECPGWYKLAKYNRNGTEMYLCSACVLGGDVLIKEEKEKVN